MPDFVSERFRSDSKEYGGSDLIGYYEYDDEGVKARPVKVVENGVLKTFLLSRSPVGEFVPLAPNGHGRRQAWIPDRFTAIQSDSCSPQSR